VRSRAAATNAPPHGAFRGFGAPQSIFAMESHLDELAGELGLAPEDIRRRNFIEKGDTLAPVQQTVDRQAGAVRDFFRRAGFRPDEIRDTGISVNQSYDYERKEDKVTVSRSIQLRSRKVMEVQSAYAKQADLIRAGVPMNSSDVVYSYTGLNSIKPAMIAEANQAARRNAEQFAKDSGAGVGSIKSASQGYFSVGPRDGDSDREGESSGSGSPFQKVRVVTTVDYDIDAG